ncbi:MAG: sulfatase [Candidatus Eisenbacteria bacterium]|nr:sulfatase [Candidatus Eisenbacteria bacterium]
MRGRSIPVRFARTALVLLALLTAGCGGRDRPNILLLTLDTTRTDRFAFYGGDGGHVLDEFAREAIVFEHAYCQAPITKPSHASMLTSRYPRTHGVMGNQDDLPEEEPLLSEFLLARGYQTAAFTSVRLLTPKSGFGRGFETFGEPPDDGRRSRPGRETIEETLAWLRGRDRTRPFFLWVHLFDPHFPYKWEEGEEGFPPLPPYDGPVMSGKIQEILESERPLTAADRDRIHALYAGKVRYADYWTGRLFDALRSEGFWEDTEIFVLSDHGEAFDHGVFLEHVNSLYQSAARIVFLWKRSAGEGGGGRRIGAPVQTLDLFPTVADLLGAGTPPTAEGRSLLPLLEGTEEPRRYAVIEEPPVTPDGAERIQERNAAFFTPDYDDEPRPPRLSGERIAVTDGEWKYVFDTEGGEEFYRLSDDPEERINRIDGADPDPLSRLRHELFRWREKRPARETAPAESLDPSTREMLEGLGYL